MTAASTHACATCRVQSFSPNPGAIGLRCVVQAPGGRRVWAGFRILEKAEFGARGSVELWSLVGEATDALRKTQASHAPPLTDTPPADALWAAAVEAMFQMRPDRARYADGLLRRAADQAAHRRIYLA